MSLSFTIIGTTDASFPLVDDQTEQGDADEESQGDITGDDPRHRAHVYLGAGTTLWEYATQPAQDFSRGLFYTCRPRNRHKPSHIKQQLQ